MEEKEKESAIKGKYVYTDYEGQSIGVLKKIKAEVDCFKRNDLECVLLPLKRRDSKIIKILFRFPCGIDNVKWPSPHEFKDCNFLYIRRDIFTTGFIKFLLKVKKINSSIKILVEIPTYPYDKELLGEGIKNIPLLLRDKSGRRRLKEAVDWLVVIGKTDRKLWNVPVIKMCNGVLTDCINCRTPINDKNVINILFVANFARYHGADIFINGMVDYYNNGGKRDIHLYLVGPSENLEIEKGIIEKNKRFIGTKVHILGKKVGAELNQLYDLCDIGIVSQGYHRLNLTYNTTIKNKEYLAVGLPIICDTEIDILNGENSPYVLYTDYGMKSTDINKVVEFYDDVYKDQTLEEKKKIASEIRNMYINRISYDNTMREVIERIKGKNND